MANINKERKKENVSLVVYPSFSMICKHVFYSYVRFHRSLGQFRIVVKRCGLVAISKVRGVTKATQITKMHPKAMFFRVCPTQSNPCKRHKQKLLSIIKNTHKSFRSRFPCIV